MLSSCNVESNGKVSPDSKINDITLKDFFKINADNVSKIDFRKERDLKTVTSKEEIERILQFLQTIEYKKLNQTPKKGWVYTITIYDKTEKVENIIAFSFLPVVIVYNNQNEVYKCNEEIFAGISELYDSIDNKETGE